MLLTRQSPITLRYTTMDLDITSEEWTNYLEGELIQIAFPRLNADEREFIMTGYTAADWETMFGKEEE